MRSGAPPSSRDLPVRRAATILGIASAVLLLLPWQVCDCGEDGPHLKLFWDHAACPHAPGDDEAPAEDGCDELWYVSAVGPSAHEIADAQPPGKAGGSAIAATPLIRALAPRPAPDPVEPTRPPRAPVSTETCLLL